MKTVCKFQLECQVDEAFLRRILVYTQAIDSEVSGLADIDINHESGLVLIPDELHVYEQTAGPARVHLDMGEVTNFIIERHEKGIGTGRLRLWWHSHTNMAAFFSSTDVRNIEELKTVGGMDPLVAVVTNTKGESYWEAHINGVVHSWEYKIQASPTVGEIVTAKEFLNKRVGILPLVYGWKGSWKRTKHDSGWGFKYWR